MIWELSLWPWLCFQMLLRRLQFYFLITDWVIFGIMCLIWDQYQSLDNDMVIKKSVKKCLAVLTLHGSSDIWSDHFMLFKCFSWTLMRLWKANRKLNSQFLLSKSFRIDLNTMLRFDFNTKHFLLNSSKIQRSKLLHTLIW